LCTIPNFCHFSELRGGYVREFEDFGIHDDAEDYLDADDPLFEEQFDIS
jgi:hypothetical protein